MEGLVAQLLKASCVLMCVKVRLGILLVALSVAASAGAGAAEAKANRASVQKPLVMRLKFNPVGVSVGVSGSVMTDGRYTLISPVVGSSTPATFIDEQAGTRRTITGCTDFGALDWPWVSATCSTTQATPPPLEQYNVVTGQERDIPVLYPACGDSDAQCQLGPVGSEWFEISVSCYHCATTSVAQNLFTGEVRALPPTTANTATDFSSPTLSRRLCSPLRQTPNNNLVIDSNGTFAYSGSPLDGFAIAYAGRDQTYLEHCGTHRRYRLNAAVETANAHELIFSQTGNLRRHQLTGIQLPSRRPLVIPVPARLTEPVVPEAPSGGVEQLLLSARKLYLTSSHGEVWAASLPAT